jgi:two-component system response regulator HydG
MKRRRSEEGQSERLRNRKAGRVLLCISDEPTVLAMRRILLEAFGYRVLTGDGGQAIAILTERPVDAAILDYQAPDSNGELVAIELKMIRPATPLLMVADDVATIPESIGNLLSGVVGRESPPTALLRQITAVLDSPRSGSKTNRVA